MSSLEVLRYLYDREEILNRFPNTGYHRLHLLNPGSSCIAPETDAKAIVVEYLDEGALPIFSGLMNKEGQEISVIGAVYYHSPEDQGKLSQTYNKLCKFCGESEVTSYVYWIKGIDKKMREMVEEEAKESKIKFEFRLSDVEELLIATRGWASRIVPLEIKSEIVAFNNYFKAKEAFNGIEALEDLRAIYKQSMRETDAKLMELEAQRYTVSGGVMDYIVRHETLKNLLGVR